jgi:hypothetical protein
MYPYILFGVPLPGPLLRAPGMYGSMKTGNGATVLMWPSVVIGSSLVLECIGFPAAGVMTAGVTGGTLVVGQGASRMFIEYVKG